MMRVLNRIAHVPPINVFFAAIQFLIVKERTDELARFYPNFTANPAPAVDISPAFRRFVLEHEEAIVEIGSTRYTQTNECRRCVALLPAIWEAPFDRFHLIDVGTSAGLNLALDRYSYRWGALEWGPPSPVVLTCEPRGRAPAPRDVEILSRTGLDLNPIDPTDPDERLWLESLIWPEHHERRDRLRAALSVAGTLPIRLVAGDAVETLPMVLDQLPVGESVVVMNSAALVQFTAEAQERFEETARAARRMRPVHRVSLESTSPDVAAFSLVVADGSGTRQIGWAHHHGEWLDLDPAVDRD